jgi:hypothetical protein
VVRSGGPQLVDREVAARDPYGDGARLTGGGDVQRRVADDRAAARLQPAAVDGRGPLDRTPRQFAAIRRVRAEAAEGEVAVQARPLELDPCGGLDASRGQAEQVAVARQPGEGLLDAGEHPVAARLPDRGGQELEPPRHHAGQLVVGRLPAEHAGEGQPSDPGGRSCRRR